MSEIKRVMEEHKKCPCCDSEDISVGSKCVSIGEDIYIRCNSCGLKMQLCKEYGWQELLKRWNTRKPMQNIVERLEETKTKSYVTGITSNPYEFGACHAMNDAIKIVKEEGGAE